MQALIPSPFVVDIRESIYDADRAHSLLSSPLVSLCNLNV